MESTDKYLIYLLILLIGAALGALIVWFRNAKGRRTAIEIDIENKLMAQQLAQVNAAIGQLKSVENTIKSENELLKTKTVRQEEVNHNLKQQIETDKGRTETVQDQMRKDFEILSNKILDEKSQKFTLQNKENLDTLLAPFKEKIESFQKKVEDTHIKSTEARFKLFEKIKTLSEAHQQLSSDAKNLTAALKGDNKAQGNWGELILEKVLESSNLRKDVEYHAQHSVTSEEGKRVQPDFVVNLPDGKHLIIDSKVSLVSYEKFMSTTDEVEKTSHLRAHMISVKNHIRQLSEKNYQGARELESPDFVLMFMPIEASFAVAVREDAELFNFAWERKIVIVSPSTLLATLRTVSSLWKQEKQNRNTEEIASHAASLYDKFVGFVEDLQKVEGHLTKAMGSYNNSMKKLSTGQGNLVRQVERLRDLGVKGRKNLDTEAIERSIDNSTVSPPINSPKES